MAATGSARVAHIMGQKIPGISGRTNEALVASFQAEMNGRVEKAHDEALEDCCGKFHLLDEATPVVQAVKDMYSKLNRFGGMSEGTHAQLLCVLAKGLAAFDMEGHICDFSGDEVLFEMDKEMLGLLDSIRSDGNVDDADTWRPMLGEIAELFACSTYKKFQAYGLFEFENMRLRRGSVALSMLAR